MKAKSKANAAPMKPERKNEIVVYQPDEVMRLEVRVLDESVWLTQAQIAELFGTKRPAITKHLANIYKTVEKDGICSILEHMGHDGSQQYRTAYYNLDAILAVGLSWGWAEVTDCTFASNSNAPAFYSYQWGYSGSADNGRDVYLWLDNDSRCTNNYVTVGGARLDADELH